MAAGVLPFAPQPTGFDWLESEPEFDPARHLQLEMPDRVRTLDEFGYTADEISRTLHRSRSRLLSGCCQTKGLR